VDWVQAEINLEMFAETLAIERIFSKYLKVYVYVSMTCIHREYSAGLMLFVPCVIFTTGNAQGLKMISEGHHILSKKEKHLPQYLWAVSAHLTKPLSQPYELSHHAISSH